MRKNVASQVIGAQMVTAADGSAFTGAVTVAVTGDGGTQATGSVGSGACTHEGNGFHTYAPAQAETNYDHVAFTFTGSGAIPVTVQVYTSFPQTGDAFSRLGAPVGASVSADIAAVPTAGENADAVWEEAQGDHATADTFGVIAAEIASILADTNTTIPALIDALPTAAEILAAGDVDGYSLEESQKLILAAAAGEISGAATTTVLVRAADDSKARITATVDADGNRSALTLDETG